MIFFFKYSSPHLSVLISPTHRNEEYAAEQGSGESCFHDLFVALAGGALAPQQRRDVERHLSDGAERGVHHCSHGKVTLCRDAVETDHKNHFVNCNEISLLVYIWLLNRDRKGKMYKGRYYLAMPIPIKYDRGMMEVMAVVNLVTEVK